MQVEAAIVALDVPVLLTIKNDGMEELPPITHILIKVMCKVPEEDDYQELIKLLKQ